ncbi:MAG: EamA family transporter [Sarcina sp.]
MLVSGQLLWKIGLDQVSLSSAKEIIFAIFNKYIFGGLVIYAVATIYWFYILKTNDLTKVYPLQSMSYIISLAAGYFILHEKINTNTFIGTIIILIGVTVISIK